MSLPVLLLSTACSTWPTWSQAAADTATLYAAGETPPEATVWAEGADLATSPDGEAIELEPGTGVQFLLSLSGAGTTAASEGGGLDTSACGVSSQFPPTDRGDYTGEVLWLPVRVTEPGTLCLEAAWSSGHTVDLLLYDVSQCAVPRGPIEDPTSGVVLGHGGVDGTAWAAGVVAGPTYAVAIAAAAPAGTDEVDLVVGVSEAFPGPSGGDSGACAAMPEVSP